MKAKSLAYRVSVPACLFVLVFLVFFQNKGFANGPWDPITPYKDGRVNTPQEIEKARAQSSSHRVISEVRIKESKIPKFGEKVGFAYLSGDRVNGEPHFDLKGTAESGGNITIPLSDVKSFTIFKVKNHWFARDEALLEVTIFPSLSPAELLQLQPSYSQLTESYTKQVRMWVFLENQDKAQLYMVGKKWDDKYEALFAIRDLELNVPVVLDWPRFLNAPIWWAVESVIKDDKYPYRVRFLK